MTLERWIASLTYNGIRFLEKPQPAVLPDGRRLRGIAFAPDLILARDRRWYVMKDGQAIETPSEQVLQMYPYNHLRVLHFMAKRRHAAIFNRRNT